MIELSTGLKIKTIGDPHLGRSFAVGRPPSRKGERENSQLKQLALELFEEDCDVNIMMGDIFDKFIVTPSVVMQVYYLYSHAALKQPNVDFILLRGNHDDSKDETESSSFDMLSHMLRGFTNIFVVEDMMIYTSRDQITNLLLCGYDAFMTTSEMLEDSQFDGYDNFFDAIFGHWDIESFGGEDTNLCPYQELGKLTDLIVTGHVHTPSRFFIDADTGQKINSELRNHYDYVEVVVTGSMQPYSHGEDPENLIYVKKTLEEYELETSIDPAAFHDKCLKIRIKADEELPTDVDCLQFSYEIIKDKSNEGEELEVVVEEFDFKDLFLECLHIHGVEEDYALEMYASYEELVSNAKDA